MRRLAAPVASDASVFPFAGDYILHSDVPTASVTSLVSLTDPLESWKSQPASGSGRCQRGRSRYPSLAGLMASGTWSPPLSPRRGASLFAANAKLGITKKGLLHWPHWSTRQTETRFEEFMSWRMNRNMYGPGPASKDSYTCAKADHPPKPYPGCHVFINHK
eukprot:gene11106-11260_t